MVDIPGAAVIDETGIPTQAAALHQDVVAAPTTSAAMTNGLPDVVRDAAKNLPALSRNYIDTITQNTKAIQNANTNYMDVLKPYSDQQQPFIDKALDAAHKLTTIRETPFGEFLGIFNSDYNPGVQRAKLQESHIGLQALQQRLETANAVRGAIISNAVAGSQGAKDIVAGTGAMLDNAQKAIQTTQMARQEQLSGMTPEQIKAGMSDGSINAAFGLAELQRKSTAGLALSNLAAVTQHAQTEAKNAFESYGLAHTPQKDLENPTDALKKSYSDQLIKQELVRRSGVDTQGVLNKNSALESNLKARAMGITALTQSTTATEIAKWIEQSKQNGNGVVVVEAPGGQKVTLNAAELQSIQLGRDQLNKEAAGYYAGQSAAAVSLDGASKAGDFAITNLNKANPTNAAVVQTDASLRAQATAHLQAGDLEGTKKVLDARNAAIDAEVNKLAGNYLPSEQHAVKQFATTGRMDQGSGAAFLSTQAINGNVFQGTPFEAMGQPFVDAVRTVIDRKGAAKGMWGSGKITLDAVAAAMADMKLDPQQVIREALQEGIKIPDPANPGKTVTASFKQAYDGQLAAAYSVQVARTLGKTDSPTEFNPFSGVIDSNGHISSTYLDKNGAFDVGHFTERLAKRDDELHTKGTLPNDQSLLKIFQLAINNPKNQADFAGDFDKNLGLHTGALHAVMANGDVGPALRSYMKVFDDRSRAAEQVVRDDKIQAEDLARRHLNYVNSNEIKRRVSPTDPLGRDRAINDTFDPRNRVLNSPTPGGNVSTDDQLLDTLNKAGLILQK